MYDDENDLVPQAPHPELYLLPSYMDPGGSTCSHSHTSEMQSFSSNPHTSFRSENTISAAVDPKEPVRFPEIKQASNQPPDLSLDGDDAADESIISIEEKEEDGSSYNSMWGDDHSQKNIHEPLQTKKGRGRNIIHIREGNLKFLVLTVAYTRIIHSKELGTREFPTE